MMHAAFAKLGRRDLLAAVAAGAALPRRVKGAVMGHVVLLGDSIFDNRRYVGSGPDVVTQLRAILPAGWKATLRAVDGAVTASVRHQLHRLPSDTSHLVVSVGGNDALGDSPLLDEAARSVADALARLAAVRERFTSDYRAMLEEVLACALPTGLCTIYDGRLPEPGGRLATTALTVYNDAITREAFARSLPVVDLRLICDEDADYANPIEPSVQGGAKIAAAIVGLVQNGAASQGRSIVVAW